MPGRLIGAGERFMVGAVTSFQERQRQAKARQDRNSQDRPWRLCQRAEPERNGDSEQSKKRNRFGQVVQHRLRGPILLRESELSEFWCHSSSQFLPAHPFATSEQTYGRSLTKLDSIGRKVVP